MKSKDLTTIIIIAVSGFIVSFLSLNAILGNPDDAKMEIKVINPIGSEVNTPSSEIFNNEAINPTVEVYVGQKDEESDEKESNENSGENESDEEVRE